MGVGWILVGLSDETGLTGWCCGAARSVAARPTIMRIHVLAPNRRQHILATPLGNENLAIMPDLSNSSDMMALEGLPEELLKYIHDYILPHCYRVTEQGVIMMKIFDIDELRMYDLQKHSKSTTSFISGLFNFVEDVQSNSC